MKKILFASVIWLLGAPLFSQSFIVSPGAYTSKEAPSGSRYPFGYRRFPKFSYLQVHCDLRGKPLVITEIAFRADQNSSCAARTMNLTLKMSSTARTASTISPTFALNHGSDIATVLSNVTVNWPSETSGPGPRQFKFAIPFPTKPFTYRNTPGLCWELRIHSNNFRYYHNMDAATSNTYSDISIKLGTGCKSASWNRPAYMSMHSYFDLGKNKWRISMSALYLGKGQTSFWLLGDSNKNLGGLSLPLDLTPFGISGCRLYTNILEVFVNKTRPSGGLVGVLYIPYNPSLVGLWIYGQTGSMDPGRPGIPLVFSNGYGDKLGAKPPLQPVSSLLKIGTDTATSGNTQKGFGLITRFKFK